MIFLKLLNVIKRLIEIKIDSVIKSRKLINNLLFLTDQKIDFSFHFLDPEHFLLIIMFDLLVLDNFVFPHGFKLVFKLFMPRVKDHSLET